MNYDLAAILPLLTHPLSLIGYALFLVFGLQRLLIKRGVIPPLRPKDAPAVVLVMLKYGFVLGILLAVSGFAFAAYDRWLQAQQKTDARVEVSDVNPTYDERIAVLDVKMRNTGETVAVLNKIALKPLQRIKFVDCRRPSYHMMPISAEYDLRIPDAMDKVIAHEIKPNGTERIRLRVIDQEAGPVFEGVKAHVEIQYNKDNVSSISRVFTFKAFGLVEIQGMFTPGSSKEEWEKCVEDNRRQFCSIGMRVYSDDPETVCSRYS